MRALLRQGAQQESGDFVLDPSALHVPLRCSVRKINSAAQTAPSPLSSGRASGRSEPAFDGGLTFADERMLRSLQTNGDFNPDRLYAIVDRFALLVNQLLTQKRENMYVSGSYQIFGLLKLKADFFWQFRRVRLMILLHDCGVTRVRRHLLLGMYSLNRGYFSARSVLQS